MRRVYILMGGLYSFDGYATSRGMLGLEERIKREVADVDVKHYLWGNYLEAYSAIVSTKPSESKTVVVGYSGGGAKAQWLALGYDYRIGKLGLPQPHIDLMVGYDPSPSWGLISDDRGQLPLPKTTRRAVCYYNAMPLMLGLGGGKYVGQQVLVRTIRMQHLAVQYSKDLHDRTIAEINKL